MAVPNMIVTLAMNASKYGAGLKKAAQQTTSFSQFAAKGFNLARTAFIGLTLAALRYIPVLANMGAESRKADIQLKFMLENMQGISVATDQTIKRMARYADQVNKATGIDDEQVKAVQRKLLVFDSLRESAGELGGTFERTTGAAIDLAAAGLGDMESQAQKLGKALQDPTRRMRGLADAGIIFTEQEKDKIKKLQESGRLFEAQEIVLGRVEARVKGLAEESATPFEKLVGQFQQIGDYIGEAMLPNLEKMNIEVGKWLSTPKGKKDVQAIADAFVAAAYGIKEMANFLSDVKGLLDSITKFNFDWVTALSRFINGVAGVQNRARGDMSGRGSEPFGGTSRAPSGAPIINFNTPIDSVSAGREVARVLADYSRANGGR